jgi:hypothetical protein
MTYLSKSLPISFTTLNGHRIVAPVWQSIADCSSHRSVGIGSLLRLPIVLCGMRWYTLSTIPMHRPKQAEGFQCISVKLQKKPTTSHIQKPTTLSIYKVDDILLSILPHQTITMPGDLGLSHLLPSLPSFPMLHSYLWSSLRSFPIPWPCLLLFHCKSSFHILFYTTYYHFPIIALLIHCLVVIS